MGFAELGWVETASKEAKALVLEKEVFGPFLAAATLSGGAKPHEAGPWLEKAADFASSDAVVGSLSCTVLAPESLEDEAAERRAESNHCGGNF